MKYIYEDIWLKEDDDPVIESDSYYYYVTVKKGGVSDILYEGVVQRKPDGSRISVRINDVLKSYYKPTLPSDFGMTRTSECIVNNTAVPEVRAFMLPDPWGGSDDQIRYTAAASLSDYVLMVYPSANEEDKVKHSASNVRNLCGEIVYSFVGGADGPTTENITSYITLCITDTSPMSNMSYYLYNSSDVHLGSGYIYFTRVTSNTNVFIFKIVCSIPKSYMYSINKGGCYYMLNIPGCSPFRINIEAKATEYVLFNTRLCGVDTLLINGNVNLKEDITALKLLSYDEKEFVSSIKNQLNFNINFSGYPYEMADTLNSLYNSKEVLLYYIDRADNYRYYKYCTVDEKSFSYKGWSNSKKVFFPTIKLKENRTQII